MKVTLDSNYIQTNNNLKNNNISFNGRFQVLKSVLNKSKAGNDEFFYSSVSSFLNQSEKSLKQYTEPFLRYKMPFLYTLAQKFNIDKRFMTPDKMKESKDFLFKIYDKVKSPNQTYKSMISMSNYDFEQINNIVDMTSKHPEKLQLIDNLFSLYGQHNGKYTIPYETMRDFLSSPLSKKITKNFKNYEPFIKLNPDDTKVVSNLEKEIAKGYDKGVFEKRLEIKHLVEDSCVLNKMDKSLLEDNYNANGLKVLKQIDEIYAPLSMKGKEDVADRTNLLYEIYNTTNDKNASLREDIAKFAVQRINFDSRAEKAPIESLAKIYKLVDNSPEGFKFLSKAFESGYFLNSFPDIEKTLLKGDLKLLNKYPEEVKELLWFNGCAANITSKDIDTMRKRINKSKKGYFAKLGDKIKSIFKISKKSNSDNTVHVSKTTLSEPEKLDIIENSKNKIKYPTYASVPVSCGRKKDTIEKVNAIIDKKLSRLNFNEQNWQKRDYAIKASKIRLSLLDEMFKSVKDTRLADRAAGRKPSVSNKDVLRLYEAINGKNVNYIKKLLTDTDEKGNRQFNILEIAEFFENKNKENNLKRLQRNKTFIG